jgi:hypothetical protein
MSNYIFCVKMLFFLVFGFPQRFVFCGSCCHVFYGCVTTDGILDY